jgi:cell division initiation protein
MKLTPLDIRKQEFKKVMRGYDAVEVDTFMEMMANEFEELLKQYKDMRDKIVEVETQLKDYRQIEKTLQQTLLQAQETTGRTYEAARREAETILREAEVRAAKMLEQSAVKLDQTNNEIVRLRGKRASLLARLRLLLSSELELLKTMEPDSDEGGPGHGTGKDAIDLDAILNKVGDDAAPREN